MVATHLWLSAAIGLLSLLTPVVSAAPTEALAPTAVAKRDYVTNTITWTIAKGTPGVDPTPDPNNSSKEYYFINHQWPPPSIEVNVYEYIELTVINVDIAEGVTLHAHGFDQQYRNKEDGPEGITQWCAP
jgi:hypothetical protein